LRPPISGYRQRFVLSWRGHAAGNNTEQTRCGPPPGRIGWLPTPVGDGGGLSFLNPRLVSALKHNKGHAVGEGDTTRPVKRNPERSSTPDCPRSPIQRGRSCGRADPGACAVIHRSSQNGGWSQLSTANSVIGACGQAFCSSCGHRAHEKLWHRLRAPPLLCSPATAASGLHRLGIYPLASNVMRRKLADRHHAQSQTLRSLSAPSLSPSAHERSELPRQPFLHYPGRRAQPLLARNRSSPGVAPRIAKCRQPR
jgi:hypothetical protein